VITWLEEGGVNDVVSGVDKAFDFTILRRCVRAREAISNTMLCKKIAKSICKKFASIVTLHNFNGYIKLSVHIFNKILKGSTSIRFIAQRECPRVMREIIKHNKIIFVTRKTNNGGCPQVAMNKLKCSRCVGGGCRKWVASVAA
jgi:hypothetical protein